MKNYLQLARHEGNSALFDVVEMTVISSKWGVPLHLHAEGLRGTGKTTIMRAARDIFPRITRIKGCLYNCDPQRPHCPAHRDLHPDVIAQLETEEIPMPFLEISHSAKIGTIVGSIDLAGITDRTNPTAAILPGIIPQAHRGIIFIDEINRLADTSPELTDVLLDVMGTKPGRVQIEETGLPVVEIPVQVSVWAASNPDEEPGPLQDIRRQLADRFDLVIDMKRTDDPDAIASILKQASHVRIQEPVNPLDIHARNVRTRKELEGIAGKHAGLDLPDFLRNYIARLYVKYDIESFRAIEAIQHAALLNCALRQRDTVLVSDVIKVLPLALRHRVDLEILTRIMNSTPGHSATPVNTVSMSAVRDDETVAVTGSPEPGPVKEKQSADGKSLVNRMLNTLGLKKDHDEISFAAANAQPDLPDVSETSGQTADLKRISEINLNDLIRTDKNLKP